MKNAISLFLVLISSHPFAQEPIMILPIGHTLSVNSAEFSPNGKLVLTVSLDYTAKIWEASSGKLIADLKGHREVISIGKFSSDGTKIVTASHDSTAKIWDVTTGELLFDLIGHKALLTDAQFSPNDKNIITSSNDGTSMIWEVSTGKLIARLKHRYSPHFSRYSSDGKKIATYGYKSAYVWDATSYKRIVNLDKYAEEAWPIKFSPDLTKIITVSSDNSAKVWETATGMLLANLNGHSQAIKSVEFSPNGKMIVTASLDSTAKIWNAETAELIFDLRTHKSGVIAATFSSNGKKITTASNDHTIKIWDVSTGNLIADIKGRPSNEGCWHTTKFSTDAKKVLIPSEYAVEIWDAEKGNLMVVLKGHTVREHSAEFSADGMKILTVSWFSARIWNAQNGKLLIDLKVPEHGISAATFSPDGSKIVTAISDNSAKVWNATTGKLLANFKGHSRAVEYVVFSPDGKMVATASNDSTAKIWDVETGELIFDFRTHKSAVTYVKFSSDGKYIVTVWDSTAKIWDVASGQLIIDLKGHTDYINAVEFSPDSKKIVTASEDYSVKVWETSTWGLTADLIGHTEGVTSVQFSPDGTKILSSSFKDVKVWDGSQGIVHTISIYNDYSKFSPDGKKLITASGPKVEVWDVESRALLAVMNTNSSFIYSVSFSPDGTKVITTSSDHTSKVWDASNGSLLYTFFAVDNTDYLVMDNLGRYDGTEGARKLLYFRCGTEIIDLDQVKDLMWVPNLVERILSGDTINAPNLTQLNICGLTPKVEKGQENGEEYRYKITPQRGGLGETVLYINGIEANRYNPNDLKKNGSVYELTINKWELNSLFVDGWENSIMIKAYTQDNTLSSRGAWTNNTRTKSNDSRPNLFAVMVGVSDYKGEKLDLQYAAKDADDLSNAIGIAARKLLNTDGKEHVFIYRLTTGIDRYQFPEKNSVKSILLQISEKAAANDILLIFFAGHGIMDGDSNQFYFLTADASEFTNLSNVGISMAELTDWMKPEKIKAQKRILILDACNSGQAIKDFVKMGDESQNYVVARSNVQTLQLKAIDKLNERSGLFILSASSSNQSAYEVNRYSQGLLTYSLLKAIKHDPTILEEGKYLDVSRWFNSAEKTVSELAIENGTKQDPQIVTNTNFNIGIVDDTLISKIDLKTLKPVFTYSNFQNSDDAIADDNLGISNLINIGLQKLNYHDTETKLVFQPLTNSSEAYTLSGRYSVDGNVIVVHVNIKQNKVIKQKFELTGSMDNLMALVDGVAMKAMEFIN